MQVPGFSWGYLTQRHHATVLMAAPGNLCRLTATIVRQGKQPAATYAVRTLIVSGEKLPTRQRSYLASAWQATVISLYGAAETDSLAIECRQCHAHKLLSDYFFFERLCGDEAQSLPLHPRTALSGELVVTILYRQGTPLIRYRLGDMVRVLSACDFCHHLSLPTLHIIGRVIPSVTLSDGTKLYSYQVERALERAISGPFCCQVTLTQEHGRARLHRVVFCEQVESGQEARLQEYLGEASLDLADALRAGVVASIEVVCKNLAALPLNQSGKVVTLSDHQTDR